LILPDQAVSSPDRCNSACKRIQQFATPCILEQKACDKQCMACNVAGCLYCNVKYENTICPSRLRCQQQCHRKNYSCGSRHMYGSHNSIPLCAVFWMHTAMNAVDYELMSANNIIRTLIHDGRIEAVKQILTDDIMLLMINKYSTEKSMANKLLKMLLLPKYNQLRYLEDPTLENYYKLQSWYFKKWELSRDNLGGTLITGLEKLLRLKYYIDRERYSDAKLPYIIIGQDGSITYQHWVHAAASYVCIDLISNKPEEVYYSKRDRCDVDMIEVPLSLKPLNKLAAIDLRYSDYNSMKVLDGLKFNSSYDPSKSVSCGNPSKCDSVDLQPIFKHGKSLMKYLIKFRYLKVGNDIVSIKNLLQKIKDHCEPERIKRLECYLKYIAKNIYDIELNMRYSK